MSTRVVLMTISGFIFYIHVSQLTGESKNLAILGLHDWWAHENHHSLALLFGWFSSLLLYLLNCSSLLCALLLVWLQQLHCHSFETWIAFGSLKFLWCQIPLLTVTYHTYENNIPPLIIICSIQFPCHVDDSYYYSSHTSTHNTLCSTLYHTHCHSYYSTLSIVLWVSGRHRWGRPGFGIVSLWDKVQHILTMLMSMRWWSSCCIVCLHFPCEYLHKGNVNILYSSSYHVQKVQGHENHISCHYSNLETFTRTLYRATLVAIKPPVCKTHVCRSNGFVIVMKH